MAFNPLGNFDQNAALDEGVIEKAKAFLGTLTPVPAGLLQRVYLHWFVGCYDSESSDYNVEALIDDATKDWVLRIETDPANNAPNFNTGAEAEHTYWRNTGAVGIAITGMGGDDVSPSNFGAYPVTVAGLHMLCAGAAALCVKYDIDASGTSTGTPYGGEPTILTHAEAANRPGDPAQYSPYGPPPEGDMERWDLSTFTPVPDGVSVTSSMATTCGNALRWLIHRYKVALL